MKNTTTQYQITPGPWKWVFLGNAGNYFLLGNNGAGPIVQGGPGFPDGNLMQAAPAMWAALTEGIGVEAGKDFADELDGIALILGTGFPTIGNGLRAKAQAIRAAIADARGVAL